MKRFLKINETGFKKALCLTLYNDKKKKWKTVKSRKMKMKKMIKSLVLISIQTQLFSQLKKRTR